jgi:hypothetical protein
MNKAGEFPIGFIQQVQSSSFSTNPQSFFAILKDEVHIIVAQALSIIRTMLVMSEFSGFGIKEVQTGFCSSNPDEPIIIGQDGGYIIAIEAIGIIGIMHKIEEVLGFMIEPAQSTRFGSYP